ncbi:unnamed protein product [Thelazia callipaeda]|uniref:Kinesin motor domain-containing protein n=1 Tax=Thelazia callipaeda TaxID=103827 RepID=A0A0N5D7Z6_THECL|nr:unnamed protein product [Thelazia callipaeda]
MTDVIPIRVVVRVRPLSSREKAENSQECVQCFVEQNQIAINGKMFAFDSVFDPSTLQEVVYDICAAPLIEKIFEGYNCTILAYGQTGSGKTYTMGSEEASMDMSIEERGIISRIVDSIFMEIDGSEKYRVTASMLEIYEGKVMDLLSINRQRLHIRESKGVVFVQGLSEHPIKCLTDALDLLKKGCHMRSKGETAMNDKSSRSHAIFTLCIEKNESDNNAKLKSKLHLVDLAGSERLKKTQAEGERMKEGIKINEGLLALGNVIAALTDRNTSSRHVPYRVAKITRLLQDSLGGNSYTVMIACISPADTNADESLSTLRYADRAKRIKNKPTVNIDPHIVLVQSLRDELASVKHELATLYAKQNFGDKRTDETQTKCPRCEELEAEKELIRRDQDCRNLFFAEAITQNSKLVDQFIASQQIIEQFKSHIKEIKSKIDNKQYDEASEILSSAMKSRFPVEEKQREVLDDGSISSIWASVGDADDETSDQGFVSNFTEKQIALNKNMTNILEEINQKELAFEATIASQTEIARMRDTFASDLGQLQKKLDALEKEKQELLNKIKGSSIHHKLSEDRRKRLQELEKEVNENKKRITEIQRLQKRNIRLEEQSKKFVMEIADLKKSLVKMSKQMKEEEVKFRKWKATADRQMEQLNSQARKREVELARAQQNKDLQLTVYRRKYEEASACNRRLQMQLAKCTARTKTSDKRQFISSLDDELAVAYSAAEAEIHCQVLIEQRKVLSTQQQNLLRKLNELKHEAESSQSLDYEDEKKTIEEQLKRLQKEIELRGSELGDIQKKCTTACSDEQRDQLWNSLNNLSEAKTALRRLFNATVNEKRSSLEKELIIEEQKRNSNDILEKYKRELTAVQRELSSVKIQMENMRKKFAESERCYAQDECDMINIWNRMAEGHFDLPDHVVKNLSLVKGAAENFVKFQQNLQKQIYSRRLRRRTGLAGSVGSDIPFPTSIPEEEQKEETDTKYQLRQNQKTVERLGAITDISEIYADESEEHKSVSDDDISYRPSSSKDRKRSSNVTDAEHQDVFTSRKKIHLDREQNSEVPGPSKDSDFHSNETYNIVQGPKESELISELSSILDNKPIITSDLFDNK